MRTHIITFKNFLFSTLLCFVLVSCKNDAQNSSNEATDANHVSRASKNKKQSEERKVISGIVEVQYDGQTANFTDFDQNMSTDVVYLDNGIQFRINTTNNQSVLVNMYAPDFFKKIPITISQQTYALPPGESGDVKSQSRLEVIIPTVPENKRDFKVLYKGTVTLNELSENRLVVTFSGTGLPIADSKDDFFPFEGKIVLESFNIYDFRE